MKANPSDRIEVGEPVIKAGSLRMKIIENQIADLNSEMPAIVSNGVLSTVMTQAHNKIAPAASTNLQDSPRVSGTRKSLSDREGAGFAVEHTETLGALRGHVMRVAGHFSLAIIPRKPNCTWSNLLV
jgi:hypothetical protein